MKTKTKLLIPWRYASWRTTLLLVAMILGVSFAWQSNAQTQGESCDAPITISELPFNDSGNTGDYGNNYSSSDVPSTAPGAVTNGTGSTSYLSGDEVVYAITPTSDGEITINTTNEDDWIGLWVFTGCSFESTVGYHTATGGFSRSVPNLPVTASETYYIVISTWADPQSTDFTIEIEGTPGLLMPFEDCANADAGTIMDDFSICAGTAFTLETEGASSQQEGLQGQWMVSTDGGANYQPIEGATSSSFTVEDGISEETMYYYAMTCNVDGSGDITSAVTVSLNPAADCYCEPGGTNSSYYINSFRANNMENLDSGFSTGGYGDFTDMTIYGYAGEEVDFSAYTNGGTAGFRIWVDWNNDGNFDPVDEVAYQSSGYESIHEGSFEVPSDAEGEFRMRIVSHWLNMTGNIDPCAPAHTYGEFEDYTLFVEIPYCIKPTNVEVSNIMHFGADLSWDHNIGTQSYHIRYGLQDFDPDTYNGSGVWSLEVENEDPEVDEIFTTLENLDSDTQYYVYVKGDCDMYHSSWAGPIVFTTDIACYPPTDINVSDITVDSALLTWEGDAEVYNIEWGEAGFDQGEGEEEIYVESPFELNDLASNTAYEFYIQAHCDLEYGNSTWEGPFSFTTACTATDIPFTQDFEGVSTPNIPDCAALEVNNGNAWKTTSLSLYGFNGKVLNYSYHTTTGEADSWYFTNGINLETGVDYQISYQYGNNSTFYTEKLKVAMGQSASSSAMTEELADYEFSFSGSETDEIIFSVDSDGVYYFGFQAHSARNQHYMYLDNIHIDLAPTCLKPSDLAVSDITYTSAVVTWEGDANAYNIEYGEAGFEQGNGELIEGVTSPYTLEDLSSSTSYDVYVQADCGTTGGVSEWVNVSFDSMYNCDESAIEIASAPVYDQALVCSDTNNLNSNTVQNTCQSGANTSYMGGNEALYTFIPSESGFYEISYSGQTWSSIFVYSNSCPTTGGDCEGSIGNSLANKSLLVNMEAGVKYYIWFDTYPAPNSPCEGTFSLEMKESCEGMPDAGLVSIDPDSGQSGTSVTLSAEDYQDNTDILGISYQWEMSTDNGDNWSNLGTSSGSYADRNQTVSGNHADVILYRLAVSCSVSETTSYSNEVSFTIDNSGCTPSFSYSSDYIVDFELANISNLDSGFSSGGYGDFTNMIADLEEGETYETTIKSSAGTGNHGLAIWIDYNDDGVFDVSERIGSYSNITANQTVNLTFTVPEGSAGTHTLRVVYQYDVSGDNISPCASANYGEAEDYTVNISASNEDCAIVSQILGLDEFEDSSAFATVCSDDANLGIWWDALGNYGEKTAFVVVDQNDEILNILSNDIDFDTEGSYGLSADLTGYAEGVYYILHINWNGELNGLAVGNNISEVDGDCFAWAVNEIEVTVENCDDPADCESPLGITVNNVTEDSAEITWSAANEGDDTWEISITTGGQSADQGIIATVTGTPSYEATGLDADTTYLVYLRTICSEDESSEWAYNGDFTTLEAVEEFDCEDLQANIGDVCYDEEGNEGVVTEDCDCFVEIEDECEAPLGITVNNVTEDSADITWSAANEGDDTWEISITTGGQSADQGMTAVVTGTPSYEATGLEADTTYLVYLRTICSEDESSEWAYNGDFTTLEAVEEFDCEDLQANIGDVCYDEEGNEGVVTEDCDCFVEPVVEDCAAPSDVTVTEGEEQFGYPSALLSWTANGDETMWEVVYNTVPSFDPNGATPEQVFDTPETQIFFLESGLTYYFYVRAVCDLGGDNNSDWVAAEEFTMPEFDCEDLQANIGDVCFDDDGNEGVVTEDCDCFVEIEDDCEAPSDVTVTEGEEQFGYPSALLSWTANGDETMWEVVYNTVPSFDPNGATPEQVFDTPETQIFFLEPGLTYYFYVRAVCDLGGDNNSDWVATEEFTMPEFDCEDLQANIGDVCFDDDGNEGVVTEDCDCFVEIEDECEAPSADDNNIFISKIHIDGIGVDIDNDYYDLDYTSSAKSAGGYAVVDSPEFTIYPNYNGSYSVSSGPAGNGGAYYYAVWIDFNGDGCFDEDEQVIWSNGAITNDQFDDEDVPSTFSVLAPGTYTARIRNSMQTWPSAHGAGDGEALDFTLHIVSEDEAEHILGIDNQVFNNFSFYPNPVQHQLNLKAGNSIEQVEVYNLLGQKVISVQPNTLETIIDTDRLQAGVYMMSVMIDGSQKTYKIVKK